MSRIYVATTLTNHHRAQMVAAAMEMAGHVITCPWWTMLGGDLTRERLATIAQAERQGVQDAELVIALMPGGRGTHYEIGYAMGRGTPVILHSEDGGDFIAGPSACSFHFLEDGVRQSRGSLDSPANLAALVFLVEDIGRQGGIPARYGHASNVVDLITRRTGA